MAGPLGRLESHIGAMHLQSHTELLTALDGARYRAPLENCRGLIRHPGAFASLPNRAGKPMRDVATKLLQNRHKKILKVGRKIDTHSPDAALHNLRKDCKKLCYCLEFFAELHPPEANRAAVKALRRL